MNFLVIGLGSMGKRRIRNLKKISSEYTIYGIDPREDRRNEAKEKYNIDVYASIEEFSKLDEVNAFVISVPPDKHMHYAEIALKNGKHSFIEASVVDEGLSELIEANKGNKVVFCPSCTLRFHPSIKLIKSLIDEGKLGKLSNFSYHSGQYLPDWHPWENINEFYVSNPATGGCREIVPFELTWLNWVFGDIDEIFGFNKKTIELDAPIDDTYASVIQYKSGVIGTLIVDVVSRSAIRKLVINGDKGQLVWDWDKKCVDLYDAEAQRWIQYHEPVGVAEAGYNANIIEEMYVAEVQQFVDAFSLGKPFSNSLEEDYLILKNLYGIEQACLTGKSTKF